MSNSIFFMTLRERSKGSFIWVTCIFFMTLLIVGLFESVADSYSEISDIFSKEMQAFIGDVTIINTPAGWLAIELYELILPLILIIIAIGFGSSAIGTEEDSSTLELLLASPVSRSTILFQKASAVIFQLGIISLASYTAVFFGTFLFTFPIDLLNVFAANVMVWLLGIWFGFLALSVQCVTGKRSVATGLGTLIAVLTYFANVLPKLINDIELVKYFSPFYLYNSSKLLNEGSNISHILIMVVCACIFYYIAHYTFVRRDLGI